LNLGGILYKKDTSPGVLRCYALETIDMKYPDSEWLHVYTDGSLFDDHMTAGSGVFSSLFSFYASAGKYRTAFDGEVEAIRIALKQLLVFVEKFSKVVLFSDSQAAIQAIGSNSPPLSDEIFQCRVYLRNLIVKKKHVVLQWIPGHCGVKGNEQADFLARKGSRLLQSRCSVISYHSIKLYIKQIMAKNFKLQLLDRLQTKRWRVDDLLTIPNGPRREAVAQFRLLTGHDCMGEHLHRIGIFDKPNCPLCNMAEPMNRAHLHRCMSLHGDSETALYWRARELLRQ
jgi:ribonuclease HI